MKSMTGFGKAKLSTDISNFSCELQSVNRKHLDIKIALPTELRAFEPRLHKHLSSKLSRGAISLRVKYQCHSTNSTSISANIGLASKVYKAGIELEKALGIKDRSIANSLLLQQRDLLVQDEDETPLEAIFKPLIELVDLALTEYNCSRTEEGTELQKDIDLRLKKLSVIASSIESLSENSAKFFHEKLTKRIAELTELEMDEHVAREVALLADKADITEELVRLRAHIKHFDVVISQEGSIGKTLDFILQEMFREVNTMGSKSQEIEITRLVVEAKTEVERIREQVQNIE